ncbi:MAG: hypothetical protein [Siphoviridae sp. ct7UA22]|nr:MAG: hypothetical protein [Siphoviridae sp. ct7UA22]
MLLRCDFYMRKVSKSPYTSLDFSPPFLYP